MTTDAYNLMRLKQRLQSLEAVLIVAKKWLDAYDATGPDNGPSLTEHDCAEAMRILLQHTPIPPKEMTHG